MEKNIATREPLTKAELNKLFWRYQLQYLYCCNLENWHGNCYAYDMPRCIASTTTKRVSARA